MHKSSAVRATRIRDKDPATGPRAANDAQPCVSACGGSLKMLARTSLYRQGLKPCLQRTSKGRRRLAGAMTAQIWAAINLWSCSRCGVREIRGASW